MCINQSNEWPLIRHVHGLWLCEDELAESRGTSRSGQHFIFSGVLRQLLFVHSTSSAPTTTVLPDHVTCGKCHVVSATWNVSPPNTLTSELPWMPIHSQPSLPNVLSLDTIDISQPTMWSLLCFSGSPPPRHLYIALPVGIGFNMTSSIKVSYRRA